MRVFLSRYLSTLWINQHIASVYFFQDFVKESSILIKNRFWWISIENEFPWSVHLWWVANCRWLTCSRSCINIVYPCVCKTTTQSNIHKIVFWNCASNHVVQKWVDIGPFSISQEWKQNIFHRTCKKGMIWSGFSASQSVTRWPLGGNLLQFHQYWSVCPVWIITFLNWIFFPLASTWKLSFLIHTIFCDSGAAGQSLQSSYKLTSLKFLCEKVWTLSHNSCSHIDL